MKRAFRFKKRTWILFGIVAAVAAMASVGAYAYFTATGSGTGTASVGSSENIVLTGTITGTLYPAGVAADVDVLVENPGDGSQYVGDVHLDSIDADAAHATCDTSVSGANPAFTMADIPVQATLTRDGTAGDSTTVSGSIQMNDTLVSQDDCQGATLTLNLSSN